MCYSAGTTRRGNNLMAEQWDQVRSPGSSTHSHQAMLAPCCTGRSVGNCKENWQRGIPPEPAVFFTPRRLLLFSTVPILTFLDPAAAALVFTEFALPGPAVNADARRSCCFARYIKVFAGAAPRSRSLQGAQLVPPARAACLPPVPPRRACLLPLLSSASFGCCPPHAFRQVGHT